MIYLVLIIGMFALIAIGSTMGLGDGTIMLVGIIFAIILVISSDNKDKNKLKAAHEKTKNILEFDEKTGVITIKQRNKDIAKQFNFENYVSTRHGYAQEKIIYTSATVGGVTTGGFDKVGGYGTEKKKTDKYNLIYQYVDSETNSTKKICVTKIKLSDELAKKAQNSKVKEYLNAKGNSIIVITELQSSEKEKQAYVNLHRISGGGYTTHLANLEEDDKIRTLPTLKKCSDIISWISGNN